MHVCLRLMACVAVSIHTRMHACMHTYMHALECMYSMENTEPNPLLLAADNGAPLPAYELLAWEKEREGRRPQRSNAAA